MMNSVFGVFTASLLVICLICAVIVYKKRRYGLLILFLLNALSNLVATIQAFNGKLF
ncbi:hypothetical protein [Streptococcus pacificus]|uniref:Uncharacterized protein n=1 Tax=Streptococcus pacificus TaxID=2740577 RepID=A0ABS0ZI81_9STRE|nr:hypothetical protein [Streptococcus pacificus]MBJ8325662.1 hypothetical protein [Streptococcus pacificus]